MKTWPQQSKLMQKQISKFADLFQFYFLSIFYFSKYILQKIVDYRQHKIILHKYFHDLSLLFSFTLFILFIFLFYFVFILFFFFCIVSIRKLIPFNTFVTKIAYLYWIFNFCLKDFCGKITLRIYARIRDPYFPL